MGTGAILFQLHPPPLVRESPSVKRHLTLLEADSGLLRTDEKPGDFVLVYDKDTITVKSLTKVDNFIANLEQQGFKTERTPYSCNEDIMFVKLHLPPEAALRFAAILSIDLAFQNAILIPQRAPYFKCLTNELTASTPNSPVAKRARENITIDVPRGMTSAEKGLIIHRLLEKTFYGNARNEYGIQKLLHKKAFEAAFPVNDGPGNWTDEGELNDRQLLRKYWSSVRCWNKVQPLDLVQKYYGPEVGLYFAWLGFYNKMLLFASIGGMLFFFIGIISFPDSARKNEICNSQKILCPRCIGDHCKYEYLKNACFGVKLSTIVDNPLTIAFAALMSIWATLFLEFWRREQAILQIRWNLRAVETDLSMRPEFEETAVHTRISEITNSTELYVPKKILGVRYMITASTILLLIFLMLLAIFGVMVYVRTISVIMAKASSDPVVKNNTRFFASASGSVISVIFMMIFEMIYTKVAFWLTTVENPRTQIEFDNSYAYKSFIMDFVNSYSAVFYLAFLKAKFYTYPGDQAMWNTLGGLGADLCTASGCMNDLGMQLMTILIIKNLMNTIKQYLRPKAWLILRKLQHRDEKEHLRVKFYRQWEEDYQLNAFFKYHLLDEYKQMVIQYGFVTFFVAAFPLAPFIALVNNILELRLDAYKLTDMYVRPVAFKAANLGAWNDILEAMMYISIVTNAFVIFFTSEIIPREIYRNTKNSSLAGYSDFILSPFNTSEFPQGFVPEMNFSTCYYPGFRYPPDHVNKYKRDDDYWYVLAMQLLGVVIFEHMLILITGFIAYIIPDIPFSVKQQLNYEKENLKEVRKRALTEKYLRENRGRPKDILQSVDLVPTPE